MYVEHELLLNEKDIVSTEVNLADSTRAKSSRANNCKSNVVSTFFVRGSNALLNTHRAQMLALSALIIR